MRGGKGPIGPPSWDGFRLGDEVASPSDPRAKLAIALFREAISVASVPYEFLGYLKIINIRFDKSRSQIQWINESLPLLTDTRAKSRIAELQRTEPDIGKYLYESGRCAVAHAFETPTVDPDLPGDFIRLSADMPVARALAKHFIVTEFSLAHR
jgi:hypothetical protein